MNAVIYDAVWGQPVRHLVTGLQTLPVFRWWLVNRDRGLWELNLLTFLCAVTENLESVSMRGVVSFGVRDHKPFIRLWMGGPTHTLWLIGRPTCWQD